MSDSQPPVPPPPSSSVPPPPPPAGSAPARAGRSTGAIVGAVVLAFALGALVTAIVVGSRNDGGKEGEQASPTASVSPTESASPTASVSPTASATGTAVTVDGPARTSLLAIGEAVPGFSAPDLAGGTIAWSDYVGTPTVLAVWAPWCPHCQAELPVLAQVVQQFPDVNLVSVATAVGEYPGPSPAEYMQSKGLSFPVALDDANYTLAQAFGIQAFPTIFFVGADGMVQQAYEGETPSTELQQAIQNLLAAPQSG